MSKRKSVFGALLSVALCLCAFSVASASAANVEAHTCTETGTKTGTARWTSSTCGPTVRNDMTGTFGWVAIPAGLTEVEVANGSASTLEATIGGVFVKISCTGMAGGGKVENTGGKLVGSATKVQYTGCSVSAPTGGKCRLQGGATTLETETLKAESNEMKVKYEPVGSTFITITLESAPGFTCPAALVGAKEVTGSATAEVTEEGMIQAFTSTSGSALKFGGQTAAYLGSNGLVMKGTSNAIGAVT